MSKSAKSHKEVDTKPVIQCQHVAIMVLLLSTSLFIALSPTKQRKQMWIAAIKRGPGPRLPSIDSCDCKNIELPELCYRLNNKVQFFVNRKSLRKRRKKSSPQMIVRKPWYLTATGKKKELLQCHDCIFNVCAPDWLENGTFFLFM